MTNPQVTAAFHPVSRPLSSASVYGARSHASVLFSVPDSARIVKDIVWLAVVSMVLATVALLAGMIDVFVDADLLPMTLGAGLASITFSLLGLTDKVNGR